MGKSDVNSASNLRFNGTQDCRVKALLLDAKLKGSSGQIDEDAVSGKVGVAAPRIGLRSGGQEHGSGSHGDAIFVRDVDFEFARQVGRSGVSLSETRASKERRQDEPA